MIYSATTPSSSPPRVSCTTSATGPGRGGGTRIATEAEGSIGAGGWATGAGVGCGGGGGGVDEITGSTPGVDRLPKAAGTEGAWTITVLTVGAGGAVWTTVFDPVSHPTVVPKQSKISPRVLRDGRMNEAFIVFRAVRDRYFEGKVDPRVASLPMKVRSWGWRII